MQKFQISLNRHFFNTIFNSGDSYQYGIYVYDSDHSNFTNNTITTTGNRGYPLVFDKCNYNRIIGNVLNSTGSLAYSIYILGPSLYNIVENNIITQSGSHAIHLIYNLGYPEKNNFTNNSFSNVAGNDLYIDGPSIDYNWFIDQVITKYNISGYGSYVYFKNSSFGQLKYTKRVNGTGDNLNLDILIGNNTIAVNTSEKPNLNASASLSFYNVIVDGTARPFRAGVACLSPLCTGFTSVENNYSFSVSAFTNYSVGNNTAPPKVNLVFPEDESSDTDRRVNFTWDSVVDGDGDPVTYQIMIDNEVDFDAPDVTVVGLTGLNYTPTEDLGFGVQYWRVRANDSYDVGEWSDVWNYTVESYIAISIVNGTFVEFGEVERGTSDDTTDDEPGAVVVQNDGNSFLNVSINATSLFSSVSMPDSSYQAKIGVATYEGVEETRSFDSGLSNTDWFNVPGITSLVIALLDYDNSSDIARTDILIDVPLDELAGQKESIMWFSAELGE